MNNNKANVNESIPDNVPSTNSNSGSYEMNNKKNTNSNGKMENSNPRASSNPRRFRGNYNRKPYTKKFKGFTPALEGYIFQLPEENKRDPTQFKKTIKALKNYCKDKYQVDVGSLFGKDVVTPKIQKPVKPKKIHEDDESIDSIDKDAYKE